MQPTVNDKAADPDQDGASNLTEFKGIDKTAPFVPFTSNLTTNPSQDWTSPCNANSDTDDLNLDGVINPQFEVDRAPQVSSLPITSSTATSTGRAPILRTSCCAPAPRCILNSASTGTLLTTMRRP